MAKSIKDAMSANPCAVDSDKSVAYAAKMMRDEDVGFAPIVEGDRLVGALTDRDIAVKVVAEGKDPEQTNVQEVASTELVTLTAEHDLDEALRLMARHQVRRLPIVEQDGRLVGVLAQADVAQQASAEDTGRMVEDISEEPPTR
jgi:CBS domain-containing protein